MTGKRAVLAIVALAVVLAQVLFPASAQEPNQVSFAVMPVIGILLTGLIVGAVFVFVKPRIEQAAVGAIPQLQSNKFINLIFVGVLVLISLSLAQIVLRALRLGGR